MERIQEPLLSLMDPVSLAYHWLGSLLLGEGTVASCCLPRLQQEEIRGLAATAREVYEQHLRSCNLRRAMSLILLTRLL